MAIHPLFGFNFDDGQNFDLHNPPVIDFYFDADSTTIITGIIDVNMYPDGMSLISGDTWDWSILGSFDVDFLGVAPLDLAPLVPDKFLKSQTMLDLIAALNIEIGKWTKSIYDLQYLKDPYNVGGPYIGKLADLIGLNFVDETNSTVEELRRQLLEAISWYKTKGTYSCFDYIAQLSGLSINIYDLYSPGGWSRIVDSSDNIVYDSHGRMVRTNDVDPYEVFVEKPWFVAKYDDEQPDGLTEDYFKTPHFIFEIVLNRVYTADDLSQYLWRDSLFDKTGPLIEQVRPINTVPHLLCLLICKTYEDGLVYTDPVTLVNTCITGDWDITSLYFDQGWNLDNSFSFDQSFSAFLSSIDNFKVGTGNKGNLPGPAFTLETPVYSGSITEYTIDPDGTIIFKMSVPEVEEFTGLSELALYTHSGLLVVGATFPDTDKTAGLELRIEVKVFKR